MPIKIIAQRCNSPCPDAHKRITASLVTESRCGPVTGNKRDIIAQRKKLQANRVQQFLMVATRKVGAADRTAEQHIANQCKLSLGIIEDDMSGRMSRRMNNLQLGFTDHDPVALLQPAVRLERLRRGETELPRLLGQLIDPEFIGAVWSLYRQLELRSHFTDRAHMI